MNETICRADSKYEVHCGKCHWWGMLEQLKAIYKSNPAEPEDVIPEPACPMCFSDQWLEYKEIPKEKSNE